MKDHINSEHRKNSPAHYSFSYWIVDTKDRSEKEINKKHHTIYPKDWWIQIYNSGSLHQLNLNQNLQDLQKIYNRGILHHLNLNQNLQDLQKYTRFAENLQDLQKFTTEALYTI